MMPMRIVLFMCLAQLAGAACAQTRITYHGCTDAAGNAVAALPDATIDSVVESRTADGVTAILYNPQVLPRLLPETRLFLFAHECARHNLGLSTGAERTAGDARLADCHGLEALTRSGLLDARQIATVQADLAFSATEWRLVPGPARGFSLQACRDESAARRALVQPTPGQPDWNACVRTCGERRRACRSQVASCDEVYDRCVSLCDFSSPP